MNDFAKGSLSTGVGAVTTSPHERVAHDDRAAWALAVADTLRGQLYRFSGFEGDVEPSHGRSDGALTQSRASVDGASAQTVRIGGAFDEEATANTLTGSLDGGELGRVQFSLVRDRGGLRVVLGLENAQQRALLQADQASLRHAIESLGLRVQSVSFTTPEAAGIALAQGTSGATGSPLSGSSPLPRTNMNSQKHTSASAAYKSQPTRDEDEGELDLLG